MKNIRIVTGVNNVINTFDKSLNNSLYNQGKPNNLFNDILKEEIEKNKTKKLTRKK